MNRSNEEFVRREVKKILNEEKRPLNEFMSWGDDDSTHGGGPELEVFNTIFSPFVDVFKVATVALQDIASITMDVTKYAFTFDDEKRKNIKERYRQRRKKYKEKMGKAFKSTEEIFNNEDVQLLALFANPGAVFAKKAAEMVWSGAEPIRDQVEEKFGGMLGIGDSDIAATTDRDKSPALFADLKRAFFGESLDEVDDIEFILLEQEKEADAGPAPSTAEVQEEINNFLERSGKQEEFDAMWNEIISDKKAEIEDILKEKGEQTALLGELSISESAQDAEKIIASLKAVDVDLSEAFGKVMKEIESQVAMIKEGGPEAEKIMKSLKKHPDAASIAEDAPIEQYYPLIERGLLATAFGEAVNDAKTAGVGELLGLVAEVSKEDLAQIAAQGPKGKEYSDLIFSFRDELLSI